MEPPPDDNSIILRVLDWYRAAGVDAAVAPEAIDWSARGDTPPVNTARLLPTAHPGAANPPPATGRHAPAQPQAPSPTPPTSKEVGKRQTGRVFAPPPPDAAAHEARQAAAAAPDLAALQAVLADFDGCGLKATAKNLCFFRGSASAPLMVIGEAPGRDEDIAGSPFVGKAGQLLDRMLAAIGIDEAGVHITNVVYWRPPGNRTPTPQEVLVCRPFLDRQIELVAPRVILTVGGPASQALLGQGAGIMRMRGKWQDVTIGRHTARVMPTFHPAYLLRTPAGKRHTWRDLLAVRTVLDGQ
ncbi:MAG: uracil-DNA glycosylase [Hyphomicrobiaceae bacterium]|nr:uracil-DNA glycosylase [Hyphomicrobiaceae bacterium]